jgi:hypothetical protein
MEKQSTYKKIQKILKIILIIFWTPCFIIALPIAVFICIFKYDNWADCKETLLDFWFIRD